MTDEPKQHEQRTDTAIRRDVTDDRLCVLTFDRPDSSANIFDQAALEELNAHLEFVEKQTDLIGVVFVSAKPSIFIAGADIHALARVCDAPAAALAELDRLIRFGQEVFNRIAALSVPTVAAIQGACVGGGCELALACDYRVATPERATKIGLPEINLGILPAWGGSTRLPRLIGLPKALSIILAGKTLPARQALRYGLVDELAPREALLVAARRQIARGKGRPALHRLLNNRVSAAVIARKARSQILAKTRGHYPAPVKALEVVVNGISRSIPESLEMERIAVKELAQTSACHNLIRLFLLQERAKKAGKSAEPGRAFAPVKRAAVIGAGVMGAGIAQWLSSRGIDVILRDINPEQVNKGMLSIDRLFAQGVKRRVFTSLEARAGKDRIKPAATEVPLTSAEVIIEAAVEKMDLKKEIFRKLSAQSGPDTLVATNTSALSISEIAAATDAPERVVGFHFFNPVHRMQLVEVVVGQQTSFTTVQRAVRFAQQIGKLSVVVQDRPGFLVNRILMPYLIEAGQLFENGAAAKEIDAAMLDFGMPMGPLRLIDEVGVDVAAHVAHTLAGQFSDRMRVPSLLDRMMKEGWLGRKSGRGFYLHDAGKQRSNPAVDSLRKDTVASFYSREQLQRRMVLLMINEAARCLDEKVVSTPEDVDFGMVMGAGFAPFRGGPLRYADAVGAKPLVADMTRWVNAGATHFQPCDTLRRMSESGETFYPSRKGE